MLCAKCHKNEATMHFTIVVDGKDDETVQLCKDCAAMVVTNRANERPGVDAGWPLLFAFQRAWSRATQAERWVTTHL